MDQFYQSILGNLVADVFLFGCMGLFSFLYLRLKGRFGKIGSNMKVAPNHNSVSSEVDGDIYLTDESGTRNLTHSTTKEEGVVWANNSKWIAFARKTSGKWQAIVANVVTGRAVSLTEGEGDARPVEWDSADNLIVKLGGSYLTIYSQEIERRLR